MGKDPHMRPPACTAVSIAERLLHKQKKQKRNRLLRTQNEQKRIKTYTACFSVKYKWVVTAQTVEW